MFPFAKEMTKIVAGGLISLNLVASSAQAQPRPKTISKRAAPAKVSKAASGPVVPLPTSGGPGFVTSPSWPAFTLGQAATNIGTLGDALSHVPGLRPGELFSSSSNNNDTLTHNMNIFDAAEVIRAESESWIKWQEARIKGQELRAFKNQNRRQELYDWLERRTLTPTVEDERVLRAKEELRHALNLPMDETPSAAILNCLLDDLQKLRASRVRGPQVPLDQDVLLGINFSPSNKGGSIELLKKGGYLHWPLALQSPDFKAQRELFASLMPAAISQAVNGQGDASKVAEMKTSVQEIRSQLSTKIDKIPTPEHIRAKRFLDRLDDSLTVLRQPDAGAYFSGKYTAHGRTVAELVQDMTSKGLRFGPAGDDQAAYEALHQALVAYHIGSVGTQGHSHAGDIAMKMSTPARGMGVAPAAGPATKGASPKVRATAQ